MSREHALGLLAMARKDLAALGGMVCLETVEALVAHVESLRG